jgi:hypothetical protein
MLIADISEFSRIFADLRRMNIETTEEFISYALYSREYMKNYLHLNESGLDSLELIAKNHADLDYLRDMEACSLEDYPLGQGPPS